MTEKQERVLALAKAQGIIRPSDLKQLGATNSQLRGLVAAGAITRAARGLYRLSDHEFTESHSLVEAVRRQSKGVVCLLSALSFHDVGT
ncbi:MAG: type IV toxin-antitoxin system AbiEi family antitoxin domain-containing protein [Fimbriimonas sp.]|nr:type IV toxin-antitoxin system AbiEi family antitoxin domain-containing protein [Fimbriimonas sp.]